MSNITDRVKGTLVGLGVGDKNGGPIRMAVRLAESLADCLEYVEADAAGRYMEWWKNGAFDTGPTFARVMKIVDTKGLSFPEASKMVHESMGGQTAGCNAAHRIAPLAMSQNVSEAILPQAARSDARLTHWHEISGDASAFIAVLVRKLISGSSWKDSLSTAMSVCHVADDIISNGVKKAIKMADEGVGNENELSRGGFAPKVIQAAVYFVHSSSDFDSALSRSLTFAGAANYCPVLVGCIGGARWGFTSIGDLSDLERDSELFGRVNSVCDALCADWTESHDQ